MPRATHFAIAALPSGWHLYPDGTVEWHDLEADQDHETVHEPAVPAEQRGPLPVRGRNGAYRGTVRTALMSRWMEWQTDRTGLVAVMNAAGGDVSQRASRKAHRRALPAASAQRARILQCVAAAGARGMTCDEVEAALGMPHQTCSARWSELRRMVQSQHLAESGAKRPTRSGCMAAVHVVAEAAVAVGA